MTLAILGGVLIGIAVSMMWIFNGRVTGVSGILNGALTPQKSDALWRWAFLAGLFSGGLILRWFLPEAFSGQLSTPDWTVAMAGLLVGFGTVMGSGCTSGHGICGVSRISPRSLIATVTFMLAGILTVWVL